MIQGQLISSTSPLSQILDALPSSEEGLHNLRRMLQEGWQIKVPVWARLQWFTANRAHMAFVFLLRRGEEVDFLTVRDSLEVRKFLESQRLPTHYA